MTITELLSLEALDGGVLSITTDSQSCIEGTTEQLVHKFQGFEGQATIVIRGGSNEDPVNPIVVGYPVSSTVADLPVIEKGLYQVTVSAWMTKPSTPDFDFHDKFNGGVPMPMRIMVGRELQMSKSGKMVQMELWGQMIQERQTTCMMCGRQLTNPVSQFFGIGPECGHHDYVNPFDSEEELQEAIENNNKRLAAITWTGWIPVRSIIGRVIVEEEKDGSVRTRNI